MMPPVAASLIVALFGLIIGSFLNVVIYRLPRGESLVRPGSHCPGCGKPIRWYQNIPVVSYLVLRGRCGSCSEKISFRYPVVELLTALLFLAAFRRFGWSWLLPVRDFPFISLLLAITFIDLEHRIIPDPLSLGGLVLGLATSWAVPGVGLLSSFLGGVVGFGVFFGFAWVYERITGRSGLGGGDIKLLAMLGAFLGPGGVFCAILVSSVLGTIVGILYGVVTRQKTLMKVSIPYGPFLVIGGLYYYLLGDLWFRFTIPT